MSFMIHEIAGMLLERIWTTGLITPELCGHIAERIGTAATRRANFAYAARKILESHTGTWPLSTRAAAGDLRGWLCVEVDALVRRVNDKYQQQAFRKHFHRCITSFAAETDKRIDLAMAEYDLMWRTNEPIAEKEFENVMVVTLVAARTDGTVTRYLDESAQNFKEEQNNKVDIELPSSDDDKEIPEAVEEEEPPPGTTAHSRARDGSLVGQVDRLEERMLNLEALVTASNKAGDAALANLKCSIDTLNTKMHRFS